jgi:hypothetical protein
VAKRPLIRGETVGQATDHFDAPHWRRLADDARASAARTDDPDGKRRMLEIAAAYDQFAEEAEQRPGGHPLRDPKTTGRH